jgi:hypothetical protein
VELLDGRRAAKEVSLGPNVEAVRINPEHLLWAMTGRRDLHSPNGCKVVTAISTT